MREIRTAGELQDHRAFHQPIEKRRCQRRVTQGISPGFEVDGRRQHGQPPSRPCIEQSIVYRANLRLRRTFPAVEAKFVDQ
jgi:hypothetical protein